MTWNLISKEGSNHTVTTARIKWHVGILTHACCNVRENLPTERNKAQDLVQEKIHICRVSWTYNMCWKVRRSCCHFPSSRGDRPSRLWQDGWYVKLGPHNQATKYLATTNNNSSCSKLIYQIDLVCSLADHTKNTQNSTVSILNMLYILLAAKPNTYPWTANTSKTCRSCMSPGIVCAAGIDIKTSSAIWTVWIIECAVCLSGPMMSFAAFWKTTLHLSL